MITPIITSLLRIIPEEMNVYFLAELQAMIYNSQVVDL